MTDGFKIVLKEREALITSSTLSKNPMRMHELGGWIKVATTMIYSEFEQESVEYSSYSTSPYDEIHYRRTDKGSYANEVITFDARL